MMFFNRTKFNRPGVVIYSKASSYGQSAASTKVVIVVAVAAHTCSHSSGAAKANIQAAVLAHAMGYSKGRVVMFVPVSAAAHGLCLSAFRAKVNKITIATVSITAAAYVYSNASARYSAGAKTNVNSNFQGIPAKRLYIQCHFKSYSSVSARLSLIRGVKTKAFCYSYFKAISNVVAVEIISITDINFLPGDMLEIDLCNYYAALNGHNIMDKLAGDFFRLYPGKNVIVWQDNKGSRRVEIKTQYQNKYL